MTERLLTFAEVAHITGLHKSSLYRKSLDQEDPFPTYYTTVQDMRDLRNRRSRTG